MRYVRPSCVLRVAQVRARLAVVASLVTLMAGPAGRAESQQVVTQAERVISVSRGASALLVNPVPIARFSVGEPDVAEATIVSPTEVMINGKGLGTTTLFVWDNSGPGPGLLGRGHRGCSGPPALPESPDARRGDPGLGQPERRDALREREGPQLGGSAVEMARPTGATVIDNLVAPPAVQVLLQVRFAEINRTALKDWSTRLRVLNPHEISSDGNWSGFTTTVGRERDHRVPARQREREHPGPRASCHRKGRPPHAGRAEPA